MFKIRENWEIFRNRLKERQEASWLSFKSRLPENTQNSLDKFENWYKEYKETALCEIIETVVFVLVMVIIIRFYVGEIRWIPSGSMKPTLVEGDRIIVERYSRFFTTPRRGDIIVFYPPSTKLSRKPLPLLARLTGIKCKDVAYIKRVIGLPGDKLEIKFNKDNSAYVYINDKKYEEEYVKSIYEFSPCADETTLKFMPDSAVKCGPVTIPEDSYFMMGDNRGSSYDSRYWGTITSKDIVGRAVAVFWPIKRAKTLPRLENNAEN